MSFLKNYWPGVVPAYILLFFFISYILMSISVLDALIPSLYATIIFFGGMLFLIVINAEKNREHLRKCFSDLFGVYIYFMFLAVALILASTQANEIIYSLKEVFITVFFQTITFTVFYIVQSSYIRRNNWINYFEICSFLFIIIIMAGQMVIPEWTRNEWGFRLSGGTNPNTIAFVVMFILIQTHLNALFLNRWTLFRKLIWLLAVSTIIWTLSRTTFLTLGILYTIYIGYISCSKLSPILKHGIIIRKEITFNNFFKKLLQSFFVIMIMLVVLNLLADSSYYAFFKDRIFNISSVDSRFGYTDLMMTYFRENLLLGGAGWGEIDKLLPSNDELASSSHNLFARLLSETGLLGLVIILLLPAFLIVLLLKNNQIIKKVYNNPIGIYLAASILAIFLGQFFEDRYIRYTFSIHNNIIVWLLSISLIVYFQSKVIKLKTKNDNIS